MFWEVLWLLILGIGLSAVIQAVVSAKSLTRLLGDSSLKSLTLAALFGAASSSCSYAAVTLAKTLVKKGANFTSAMVFEIASTNLVIELGIILLVLMGWQFMLAEILGGILMIALIVMIFKATLSLIPQNHHITLFDKGIIFNYTFVLNILFSIVAIILIVRFFQTGGIKMFKMMDVSQGKVHHA